MPLCPKESGRLASQIRRLYGANRRAARPFWLCLTEFAAGTPIYEQCFRMNDGFAGYLVRGCVLFQITQLLLLSLSQSTPRTSVEEGI